MNLRKVKLTDFCLVSIVLIATGFFQLFSISLDSVRTIEAIIIVFFSLFYIITNLVIISKIDEKYVLVFFIIVIIGLVNSIQRFNFSFVESIYSIRPYLWILLVYPLTGMVMNEGTEHVFKCVLYPYMFMLLFRLLSFIAFNVFHFSLFPNIIQEYGSLWMRNSSIARVDVTGLMFINLVFAYFLYYKTHETKFEFFLIFIFICNLVIAEYRSMIIASILSIVAMIFFTKYRSVSISTLLIVIAVIITGLAVRWFLLSDANTLQYRYYEFNYYRKLIDYHPWFGMGLLSTMNMNTNFILHGNLDTQMYIVDLGVMNSIVQVGIIGTLILYIPVFWKLISSLIKSVKDKDRQWAILISGILFYLLPASILQDLFAEKAIVALPFLLCILNIYKLNQLQKR